MPLIRGPATDQENSQAKHAQAREEMYQALSHRERQFLTFFGLLLDCAALTLSVYVCIQGWGIYLLLWFIFASWLKFHRQRKFFGETQGQFLYRVYKETLSLLTSNAVIAIVILMPLSFAHRILYPIVSLVTQIFILMRRQRNG